MPMCLRRIEPINIGRKITNNKVEESEVGSKEECANRTMSNLIRQLASLGQHATSIFDGLESIAENIQIRAQELSKRALQVEDLLNTRNKELESSDDVPKRAKAGKTAWISKRDMDACLFQKNSRPQQIQKLYENCEEIPKLRLLEGFWETDLQKKLCVQKYSDPDMFFRNWKEQILEILQKETEELRKNRKQKKIAKRSEKTVERKKIVTKNELRRQELLKEGMIQNYKNDTTIDLDITEFNEKTDYFVENFEKYATKEIIPKEEEDVKTTTIGRDSEIDLPTPPSTPEDRYSLNLPPPPPPPHDTTDHDLLPPPPPLPMDDSNLPLPPPLPAMQQMIGGVPPPPPPPPPPPLMPMPIKSTPSQNSSAVNDGRGALMDEIKGGSALKKVDISEKPKQQLTGRDALMDQIRSGSTGLKKVDLTKKPVKTTEDLNTFEDVMKHVFDSRFAAMHSSDESEVEVSDNEAEW